MPSTKNRPKKSVFAFVGAVVVVVGIALFIKNSNTGGSDVIAQPAPPGERSNSTPTGRDEAHPSLSGLTKKKPDGSSDETKEKREPSTDPIEGDAFADIEAAGAVAIGNMKKRFDEMETERAVYRQTVSTADINSVLVEMVAPSEVEIEEARALVASELGGVGENVRRLIQGDSERLLNDYFSYENKFRIVLLGASTDPKNKTDVYYNVIDTDTPAEISLDEDGDIVGGSLDFSKFKRWSLDSFSPPPRYGHLFSLEE